MIYMTGDTHADIDYGKLLDLKKMGVSFDDTLIILGDAGICWSREYLPEFLRMYEDIGCEIIYIDGNHENFPLINVFPVVEKYGARAHQIDKRIFHIIRGEIMSIDNLRFLCIGGAVSIDKCIRTEGLDWWPEEEITDSDIENARRNLSKCDFRVDYVLTHCCDTNTVIRAFGYVPDHCTQKLMFIDEEVAYDHWLFGHYHKDFRIDYKKWVFYNKIAKITPSGPEIIYF